MIKDYQDIQGWFDYEDLYSHLAKNLPEGSSFVEVGVWKGRSICYLGQQLKSINKKFKIFAVDTFKGSSNEDAHQKEVQEHGGSLLPLFLKNLTDLNLTDLITPIEKDSIEASKLFSDNEIDFVFVDANHSYEAVIEDLKHWYPKLKPGGIIAGHDFWADSVRSAVLTFFKDKNLNVNRASQSCWVAIKA